MLVICVACCSADSQARRHPVQLRDLLNESYVSDSDSQSLMGGSQSVFILPSSYSFDQVHRMHANFVLL